MSSSAGLRECKPELEGRKSLYGRPAGTSCGRAQNRASNRDAIVRKGASGMKVRLWTGLSAVLLILVAISYYGQQRLGRRNGGLRGDALALMSAGTGFFFFAAC